MTCGPSVLGRPSARVQFRLAADSTPLARAAQFSGYDELCEPWPFVNGNEDMSLPIVIDASPSSVALASPAQIDADERDKRAAAALDSSPPSNPSQLPQQPPFANPISAAWLIVPCLACDFLMVPAFAQLNGPPAAYYFPVTLAIVGCVLAQGNLLAAYLAWSGAPFFQRLARHWLIAVGLYVVWVLGLIFCFRVLGQFVAESSNARKVAIGIGVCVPLVSLGAQFPLWLARQWFGWRLVKANASHVHSQESPLTIRDLMIATLVVAASLAIARLTPNIDGEGKAIWPLWGVSFFAASFISTIALLPAGALLLRGPFRRGLTLSCLYAGSFIAVEWLIIAIVRLTGSAPLPLFAVCLGFSLVLFTFAATLILTAAIARSRGYYLTWRQRSIPLST